MPPFNINPSRTMRLARTQLFKTSKLPARRFVSTDYHSHWRCDSKLQSMNDELKKLQPIPDEMKSLRVEIDALKNRRGYITQTLTSWRDGWREHRRYSSLPRDVFLGMFCFMLMFNLTNSTLETLSRKEAAEVEAKKESK